MPAVSKAQRRFMAACEHGAGYASCPTGMTKQQMHDFAATKESSLPERKGTDGAIEESLKAAKKKKRLKRPKAD